MADETFTNLNPMWEANGNDGNTVYVFASNRKEAREMGESELNATSTRPVQIVRLVKMGGPKG